MLVLEKLASLQNPERAKLMARYFKTGKGQYAEGDTFWGLSNPQVRSVVKEFYKQVSIEEVTTLVEYSTHEVRACGLLIWVEQFKKGSTIQRSRIVELYLSHLDYINNWDLVDLTAHFILGPWLLDKDRDILYELAQRNHLWSQRVAIITRFAFIRKGQFTDALRLCEGFLTHRHDLIHKATGWMLREIGKRDELVLKEFLDEHVLAMPRTMLRYAIEKLPPAERKAYLLAK